jgi:hypothetical protein
MGLTGNFEQLELTDGVLSVLGSSDGLDNGELLSRVVAVQQGGHVTKGPTNLNTLKWAADPALAAPAFRPGEALAFGCETYFAVNHDVLPSFVTFTWSQIVTIGGK